MKAILVMEMPKSCDDCNLCVEHGGYYRRAVVGTVMARPYGVRPEWCPLVPMPERKQNACSHGFAAGWNACLDAIEGREKHG